MNDSFIIYLVGCSRCPSVRFFGHSGKPYSFRWSEPFRAMIYEGREVTSQEFDQIAADIFAASLEQNVVRPVPKRIPNNATTATGSALAVPRFDAHAELLRVCFMLGKAEIENARLTKIAEGRPMNFDRSTPPAPAASAPVEAAPKPDFADFDPDAMTVALPTALKAVTNPAAPRPAPQMMPKVNPAPGLDAGDFDPDEMPAGYEPATA